MSKSALDYSGDDSRDCHHDGVDNEDAYDVSDGHGDGNLTFKVSAIFLLFFKLCHYDIFHLLMLQRSDLADFCCNFELITVR